MAGCKKCGATTPNRLCSSCQLAERTVDRGARFGEDDRSESGEALLDPLVECPECGRLVNRYVNDRCPDVDCRTRLPSLIEAKCDRRRSKADVTGGGE